MSHETLEQAAFSYITKTQALKLMATCLFIFTCTSIMALGLFIWVINEGHR